MRGQSNPQMLMFYTLDTETLILEDHPLRAFKRRVDAELRAMRQDIAAAYSHTGRPGIPAEQLLKATLLQALYSKELTLELSLDLYYSIFGYDKNAEPKLADLDKGFSPEYVYRESKRCVAGIGHRAKFYAGIGVDIPAGQGWGDKVGQSDPEKLALAVRRAFDAGGKGIVISREYEEMSLPSLKVIGKTIRAIARQQA